MYRLLFQRDSQAPKPLCLLMIQMIGLHGVEHLFREQFLGCVCLTWLYSAARFHSGSTDSYTVGCKRGVILPRFVWIR